MILSGTLASSAFLDALKLIGSARKTGILCASRKDQEIRLYWKSGTIVSGELQPPVDLPPEKRSKRAVEELLSWPDGGFEFNEGPLQNVEESALKIHTPSLIIEASRRFSSSLDWKEIFADRSMVFRLAPLPDSSLGHIRLGSEEWALLSLINGRRTLQEILPLSGLDEKRTLQALFGLNAAGLIVQIEPQEDDESGKLELGKVKYSRILELYTELHSLIVDRLFEAAPASAASQIQLATSKLAKAYPKIWSNVPLGASRYLPGAPLLSNVLKLPAEQRVQMMMQAFGHLLLKEILALRHVLGDDEARSALTDIRSILQMAPRRFSEVSSKILRHIKEVLQQAEQIPSRYKMGFDFFEKHHYEDAIRLWKSIPPSNPQYESSQALIVQARQLTEGRSQLRLALERGESLLTEGRGQEALEVWKAALAQTPETAAEPSRKTLLKRIEEMSKVLELLQEARTMARERRYEDARRRVADVLSLVPDLPEAKSLQAEILEKADKLSMLRELVFSGLQQYRTERYHEAIETFRRVLALEPRHQLAEDHLRFSSEKLKLIAEAEPRYSQAQASAKRGSWVEAIERWEQVTEQRPGDPVAAFFLREARFALQGERLFQEAATYCVANNFSKAVELLERILRDRPNHSEAKILLENVRRHQAQREQLDKLLEQAEHRFEAGDIHTARQLIERILELDPEHRLGRLAQAQLQQANESEPKSATGTFRTAINLRATEEKTSVNSAAAMSAIQDEIEEPTQATPRMPPIPQELAEDQTASFSTLPDAERRRLLH